MTDIQPFYNIPALKVGSVAVAGDLHIGVETHLGRKGFHIPSRTRDMCDLLMSLDDVSRLVIIGDIKDSVPGSSKQEFREIPEFFERLLERFDVINIVRGNHDTNIEEFLPSRVRIDPASGLLIGDAGFVHGHTWPSAKVMRCRTLIMAHNHPTIMFADDIGRTVTEPCWVRGNFRGISDRYDTMPDSFIMVPAFNRMLGGSPVNTGEPLLGPIMNSGIIDIDGSHIHLLDGIDLGKLRDLKVNVETGRMRKRAGTL